MCWIYKHHGNNPDCGSEQHMYKQRRHHVFYGPQGVRNPIVSGGGARRRAHALPRRLASSFAHTESLTRHLETKNKHFFFQSHSLYSKVHKHHYCPVGEGGAEGGS